MKIIKARLLLSIAIEEFNKIDKKDWSALKKAQDKINRLKSELQCTEMGLR
tara:strand:+ start:2245 stop:2397 length:153 start_codon:yes stop_codon:yes gene_type:complete